jgi:hypothetical protein
MRGGVAVCAAVQVELCEMRPVHYSSASDAARRSWVLEFLKSESEHSAMAAEGRDPAGGVTAD